MPAAANYAAPFFWWGPAWARAEWRTIGDLLRDQAIDVGHAAMVWAALARGRSLAVIAGPSGAGKSTLLGALLDLVPREARRIYIRGCFETFAFLSDSDILAHRRTLVVNEISPHLPVYLWGPAVGRLLDCAEHGFNLLATAHAESVPAFVALFTSPPLRIAALRVAAFDFVVLLDRVPESPSGRRVRGVWRMSPARDGVGFERLSLTGGAGLEGVIAPFPYDEIAIRSELLRSLQTGGIAGANELHALAQDALPSSGVEPVWRGRVASHQAQSPVRSSETTLDPPSSWRYRRH